MTRAERYDHTARIARAADADAETTRQAYYDADFAGDERGAELARSACKAAIWWRDRCHADKRVAHRAMCTAAKVQS